MRRLLRIPAGFKPRKQTRMDPNSDAHATGTSFRSKILRRRKLGFRRSEQEAAMVSESEPLTIPSTSPPANEVSSPPASNASANAEITTMAVLEPEPELATLASLSTVNEGGPLDIASANAEMLATAPDASSEQNDPFHTILTHSRNTNFRGSTLSNVNGNSTTTTVTNQYNYYVSGSLGVLPEGPYLDEHTSRPQAVLNTVNQSSASVDDVNPKPQNQAISYSDLARHAPDQSSHEDSAASDTPEVVDYTSSRFTLTVLDVVVVDAQVALPCGSKMMVPIFFF
ncbi:hypothetical protein VKT23_011482 [Stygiomarasmius scandens]|uniref:Uncharacterized protein n=1 Tax=Marasmiellus scandens TaxID=2682957 RepID=A0ABR1JD19_9AGAR